MRVYNKALLLSEFSAYSLLAPRGIFRLLLRVFQAARHGFTLSLSLHLQEALIVIFFPPL